MQRNAAFGAEQHDLHFGQASIELCAGCTATCGWLLTLASQTFLVEASGGFSSFLCLIVLQDIYTADID
ncbi:hypothetical protein [Desulfocastanea catecholica]